MTRQKWEDSWPPIGRSPQPPKGRTETVFDKFKKEHPILRRWECFKLSCTEWLAKWFNIHIDW